MTRRCVFHNASPKVHVSHMELWRHGLLISRSRWSCRVTLREMTVCGEVCGEGSAASVRKHRRRCRRCATRRRHCCVRLMSSLAQSPSQHPSHVSPSLPRLDFDSFLSLVFLFRRGSPRLPVRDTSLNTRLGLTREIHDLDSTHFNTLPPLSHKYSPDSTSVPPSFFSFIMALSILTFLPLCFSHLFLFSDSSTRPLRFVKCKRTAP